MEIPGARSQAWSVANNCSPASADSYCSGKEDAGYTDMTAVGQSVFGNSLSLGAAPNPIYSTSGSNLHACDSYFTGKEGEGYTDMAAVRNPAVSDSKVHHTSYPTSLAVQGALPESEQYVFMADSEAPSETNVHYDTVQKKQGPHSEVAKSDEKGVFCNPSWGLWFCVVLALLLAVAAILSVVVISFTLSCECDEQLDTTMAQVEQLQQELLTLSGRVNTTDEELSPIGIQDILTGGDVSFGATLTGVNSQLNCTTEMITTCHISAPQADPTKPTFQFCETTPANLHMMEYMNVTDVFCARSDSNGEFNPTVATLHNPGTGTVSCLCYVVVLDPVTPQQVDVECGLFVTHCLIPQIINATVQTQNQ